MQEAAWNNLFRRIPPDQHNCLILQTTTGAEINLQRMIRIDSDFLVALGRLCGSTDQAKVVVIPFSQITYLSFTQKLSDEQIEEFLGKPGEQAQPVVQSPPVTAPKPEPQIASSVPVAPPPAVGPSSPTPTPTPPPGENGEQLPKRPNAKSSPPSKSILLARLRQRLAEDISKQAGH